MSRLVQDLHARHAAYLEALKQATQEIAAALWAEVAQTPADKWVMLDLQGPRFKLTIAATPLAQPIIDKTHVRVSDLDYQGIVCALKAFEPQFWFVLSPAPCPTLTVYYDAKSGGVTQ
jgi:hypothetical protein